jgi:PHD/YefM family antitoxin component YafN of YafNO toxin-antitoxin module
MKRITASEARRDWFRLLDDIINGEVVVIQRHGYNVVLRREEESASLEARLPDYHALLSVPEAERADLWRWEWSGDELSLGEEGGS